MGGKEDIMKSWTRLPMEVLKDDRLTKSDTLILAILIDTIDDEESKAKVISIKELAELSETSIATVKRACKTLSDAGYISITRTGRESVYKLAKEVLPPKQRRISDYKRINMLKRNVALYISKILSIDEHRRTELQNMNLIYMMRMNKKMQEGEELTEHEKQMIEETLKGGV